VTRFCSSQNYIVKCCWQ